MERKYGKIIRSRSSHLTRRPILNHDHGLGCIFFRVQYIHTPRSYRHSVLSCFALLCFNHFEAEKIAFTV